ncbi:MAG: phage terminase large subunit family protein [Gemmobacter sp.]|nr:phage terminase large subunit family protein [Gemmobacter sp.]
MERRLVRYMRGTPVRVWERIAGRRAESLDCMVYALAARTLVEVDLGRREPELTTAAATAKRPQIFWSRWLGINILPMLG